MSPALMHVRVPDIAPGNSPLIWSRVPEFAIAFNGFSAVIPCFEAHLNATMNRVRALHGERDPVLNGQLMTFVHQEANHARYHREFNERLREAGVAGLDPLVGELKAELRRLAQTRSLEFNVAYCAGLESVATFASIYLFERCDLLFEGSDPHGANLLLWHFAEEFEHRAVCQDALRAVSGSYVTRILGLVHAFRHASGVFQKAEKLLLQHYQKDLTPAQRAASTRRSRALYWRQTRYLLPRMLKIFMPGYHPSNTGVPPRIQAALDALRSKEPIRQRIPLKPA